MKEILFNEHGSEEDPVSGYGHVLRVVSQSDPHPLWIGSGEVGSRPSNGRNLSIVEVRALRDLCNEILGDSAPAVPRVSKEEIVAQFTNGRSSNVSLSDEDVDRLATRLAQTTVCGWGWLSEQTRVEIVKHWESWLNVNLPS